ncbi:glutamate-rich protein 6 isoform X2 [Lepisosteus oculatus]|uniref:glutamate-rich protein 6 isoform X2 n=1 Tax=Lepisosteus oculatus TaxID=7918 RepID=UPI0035F52E56
MSQESVQTSDGGEQNATLSSGLRLTVENVKRLEQQFEEDQQDSALERMERYVKEAKRYCPQQKSMESWRANGPAVNANQLGDGSTAVLVPGAAGKPAGQAESSDYVLSVEEHFAQSSLYGSVFNMSKGYSDKTTITPCRSASTSPQYIQGRTLEGRTFTAVCAKTQTDWDWVVKSRSEWSRRGPQAVSSAALTDAAEGAPETEDDFQFVQFGEVESESHLTKDSQSCPEGLVVNSLSESEDTEIRNLLDGGLYNLPEVGPPCLLAYKPESKQPPPNFDLDVGWSESEEELPTCEFCQQVTAPVVAGEQLFCCEAHQKLCEFIWEEEEALSAAQAKRKIDVSPHPPFKSKQEKKAAKEKAAQKLREWELQRFKNSMTQTRFFTSLQTKTITFRLSSENPAEHKQSHFPTEVKDYSQLFTLQSGEEMRKSTHAVRKFYPGGQTFLTMFPDGTGQAFYPSGRVAIMISSVNPADFTYIILEDCAVKPKIRAIFTTRGQSTCYHLNGMIWVNLNQLGGVCCSERGVPKRRWKWLDWDPHVHAPPFQPICMALNPHTGIRILSQEQIYITFAFRRNSVRFNVGARLRVEDPRGLKKSTPDILKEDLRTRTLEIYTLLEKIQNSVKYPHCALSEKIPPQFSLSGQLHRLKEQLGKAECKKTTKICSPTKEQEE